MSRMVQIRHMPEELHRKLKARAAAAGMSLSSYLLTELRKSAETPTVQEFRARLASRPPVTVSEPPADVIRRERDSR